MRKNSFCYIKYLKVCKFFRFNGQDRILSRIFLKIVCNPLFFVTFVPLDIIILLLIR